MLTVCVQIIGGAVVAWTLTSNSQVVPHNQPIVGIVASLRPPVGA